MEISTNVTPAMIAGIAAPGGERRVSPEAQDVLDRLKAHYQSLGKPSAASNYGRHLRSFFAWAENRGYTVRSLPTEAVENFLSDLGAAGQKESTLYVMRTQLKAALRECHTSLGIDFAHLEYQTGKPREVRKAQKEREKAKRHEKRAAQTIAQAQALMAAQGLMAPVPTPTPLPNGYRIPHQTPSYIEPVAAPAAYEEPPMSTQSAPDLTGVPMNGAATQGQQPVVVVQMPPQQQMSPARPTTTIGAPPKAAGTQAPAAPRGLAINSHVFTGPYIKISRMADGTEPLVPPGTESYVTTVPLSQLAPHGDVAAFLQSFIMPNLRLSPMVSQVQFVFHELNERRQPTGRRDELVVGTPLTNLGNIGSQAPQQAAPPPSYSLHGLPPPHSSNGVDSSTAYLLRKLDDEAAESKKRAEDYQQQLREAKDAQTTFLLMQQFQKEQDLRRELEERRRMEMDRLNAPPPMPMQMLPPPMPMELPREDSSATIAKAFSEQQTRMMEIMLAGMANNKPAAPAPQKDAAEWLVPFMSQMNAQAIQQQQANQQMLVGIMQSNQQFMQALLTRENPTEKLLLAQMQEVKAAANAPKADELESFADKLQKMKMVSDMLGGGGGGATSLLGELLANAESIGEGAAKIISAANTAKAPAPQPALNGAPRQAALPPAPRAVPAQQATQDAPQAPPAPPEGALTALGGVISGVEQENDQAVVENVVSLIGALSEGAEPFPRMAQRLLNAFKDVEDPDELFTFAKSLWIVCGQKADKAQVKQVAGILAKWYSEIHQQIFGEPKSLDGVEMVNDGGDDEETEQEAAGDEAAEVA